MLFAVANIDAFFRLFCVLALIVRMACITFLGFDYPDPLGSQKLVVMS